MAILTKAANSFSVLSGTWANQTNAYGTTSDDQYATHTQASRNGTAEIQYGFPSYSTSDIPDGSTINSVKVSAEVGLSQSIGSVIDITIENPSGTDVGNIGEYSGSTADQVIESTATTIPTLQNLRDQAVFAHFLYDRANSATSETIRIDYVSITVDYTSPPINAFAQAQAQIYLPVVTREVHAQALATIDGLDFAYDTFSRSVSNGFGTADIGGEWTVITSPSSMYSVASNTGQFSVNSTDIEATAILREVSIANVEFQVDLYFPTVPSTDNTITAKIILRSSQSALDNYILVYVDYDSNSEIYISAGYLSGGSLQGIPAATLGPISVSPATWYTIRGQVVNTTNITDEPIVFVYIKFWESGTPEPIIWDIDNAESDPIISGLIMGPGSVGLGVINSSPESHIIQVDNFRAKQYIPAGFGQAQSHVVRTEQTYAQAQTSILTTYQVYAQSLAQVKTTNNVYGQAGVWIKQTYPSVLKYPYSVIADNPVAYWRLGEPNGTTAVATIGPNGTYENTPTLGVTGLTGQDNDTAVTFDRTQNEALLIPTGMPAGSTAGTSIEMWLNTGAIPAFENWDLWSQGTTLNPDFQLLRYRRWDDESCSLWWMFSDESGGQSNTYPLLGFATHADGLLGTHHIVLVHDYIAKNYKIYIDGVFFTSKDLSAYGTPVPRVADRTCKIAGYVGNNTQNVPGTFDEVAVYDYVLSPEQVMAHYLGIQHPTFAQSQASITANAVQVTQVAQAQTSIKTTYQVHAQANTWVKQVGQGYGQARAQVRRTEIAVGQSNTQIKQTYRVYAQSLTSIKTTYRGFAQGQAQIKASYTAVGQAASWTKSVYVGLAQAQAQIEGAIATVNAYAQAEVQIYVPATEARKYAQARALIGVIDNLWSAVDDPVLDNTDYIVSPRTGDYVEVALDDLGTPMWKKDHIINIIGRDSTGNGSTYIALYQGTTLISGLGTPHGFSLGIWRTFSYTLTQAEMNAITDYSNLRIRVYSFTPASGRSLISQISMQRPPAGALPRREHGQAQASIFAQAVTRNVYAQSNAQIRATYTQIAQANALIRRTENAYGQAQANIKSTYQAYAQSQTQVKASYTVVANAQVQIRATYVVSAQAQVQIKTTYFASANAQARVKNTYQIYAQAQAQIKQAYRGFAQSQAHIKQAYQGYANAAVWVEVTTTQTAQAQTKINAYAVQQYAQAIVWMAGSSINVAQAQAKINAIEVKSYAQSLASIKQTYPLVISGDGGTLVLYSSATDGYILSQSAIYGNARSGTPVGTNTAGSQIYIGQNFVSNLYNIYEAFVSFDTSAIGADTIASAVLSLRANFDQSTTDFTIEARLNNWGPTLEAADYVAGEDISSLPLLAHYNTADGFTSGTFYNFVDDALPININKTGITHLLLCSKRTTDNITPTNAEYVGVFSADQSGTAYDPKLTITLAGTEIIGPTFAQAQTSIKTTYQGYAQSGAGIKNTYTVNANTQAQIRQTYLGYGQSQVSIKQTYQGYANAATWIEVTSTTVAQAQSLIKTTYSVTAQAQAALKQSYQVYAQTQVAIKQTYQVSANAQVWIKVVSQAYAQAQTNIRASYAVHAQSQATIRQAYQVTAQAQAKIYLIVQVVAQAQAFIVSGKSVYAQSQAQIKVTTQVYAQAQAWIGGQLVVFAQAQAKVNAFAVTRLAQAATWIKRTDRVYAQAGTRILAQYQSYAQAITTLRQTYTVVAQSNASIKQTYQVHAQAQATIKAVYQQYAQAQSKINAFGVQRFAQAQVAIKFDGNAVFAQAQVRIRAFAVQSYGQALVNIKTTYRVHSQAQTGVKARYVASGQARAHVKSTYLVYANTQALIKATTYVFGQTQTQIRARTTQYAQASVTVRASSIVHAQANTKIIYTGLNAYAQAKTSVKVTGNVTFAQAQVQIKTSYRGYANAQASILTYITKYGQAQASIKNIYSVYAQAQAQITDNYSAFAQAEALIRATYTQFAQVATVILKPSAFGQAQGFIRQDRVMKNLEISDRASIRIRLQDKKAHTAATTDRKPVVAAVSDQIDKITITLSDRKSLIVAVDDAAY